MPLFGDLFIFLACGCSLISLISYGLSWRRKRDAAAYGRSFFFASTGLILGALGVLWYLILTHDFSVSYVHSYSSTDLPLYYLIASLWGGQEGTFLLWIAFTSIMGIVLMQTAGKFRNGAMVVLNLFVLSIIAILLRRSPFELLPVAQTEGAGLNPLLQNFWMTIHPPIMFVGFAASVFPFCFAVTAMVERKFDQWAEAARGWTLFAWVSLGVALVLGGYWAYTTLGWGGFWAWDPVENSSFIPWIFLSAQIHALFIKKQRDGLKRFSLFVVCLSFWSVLYGTFLTRSGVLADFSVHSFVELGINNFLIGSLALFIGVGGGLLIYRWRDISSQASYATVNSRSYLVTLGVVVLFVGGVLTLLGTSAPLLTSISGNPSAVGLEYYFATMTPIAVAVLLLLALFPAFRWNSGIQKRGLLIASGISGLIVAALLILTNFTRDPLYLLLFASAAGALVVNAYVLVTSWQAGRFRPAYLAHVGLALALVGAAVSAGFETKQTINAAQGIPFEVFGYSMTFTETKETPKGFDCHVTVSRDGDQFVAPLPHELPKNGQGVMRKPYVEKYLGYDLYLAPVALETPDNEGPGFLPLLNGESKSIDKYTFTFTGFHVPAHGGGQPTRASAGVDVTYDGKTEHLLPALVIQGDSVVPEVATFDYTAGSIYIEGIRPEEGGVVLRVNGSFVPLPDLKTATLTMEVSKKPLINLFWFGTFLLFVAGGLSMRKRRGESGHSDDGTPYETAVREVRQADRRAETSPASAYKQSY